MYAKKEKEMNSIQNLWYGNMRPAEEPGANDKYCTKLWNRIYDRIEKLEEKLGEEEKSMLSRLIDDYNEVFCDEREDSFVKGFSLGARLTAEAFCFTYEERE